MKTTQLQYREAPDRRGDAVLHEPDADASPVPVLLIHGGGWRAQDNSSVHGIAHELAENGYRSLTNNYRLITTDPWPACGDDCLEAARYLLEHHAPTGRIFVGGASAGGHLALMTGLRLPRGRVAGIVSLAGASRLDLPGHEDATLFTPAFHRQFFGTETIPDRAMLTAAEPFPYVDETAPPLLCIHSRNDQLVTPEHSLQIAAAWKAAGARAGVFLFDGEGTSHALWDTLEAQELHNRHLRPDALACMLRFLNAPEGVSLKTTTASNL